MLSEVIILFERFFYIFFPLTDITSLLDGSDQHFIPDISEQITIKFKDDPILQVDEAIDGM